jgi:PPOX class probable F420-dependent enzyme
MELAERLAGAEVLWLTTVSAVGQPQSSPVWFVWLDGDFHVASEPTAAKVANVAAHPQVSVHLDGAGTGELVVTVEGSAALGEGLGPAEPAYREKYAAGFARLGTTADEYLARFSAGLRITPSRWRSFASE